MNHNQVATSLRQSMTSTGLILLRKTPLKPSTIASNITRQNHPTGPHNLDRENSQAIALTNTNKPRAKPS